jgi:hypothetical protein
VPPRPEGCCCPARCGARRQTSARRVDRCNSVDGSQTCKLRYATLTSAGPVRSHVDPELLQLVERLADVREVAGADWPTSAHNLIARMQFTNLRSS